MAHNAFIRIDGLDAATVDSNHPDSIRLLGFTFGCQLPTTGSSGSSGTNTAGRAEHDDFTFWKRADQTSPKLMLWCCSGRQISWAEVVLCDVSNMRDVFMTYRMSEVIVRRVAPTLESVGSAGDEGFVTEEVSLRYGRIDWTYNILSGAKAGGTISYGWDVKTNRGG